MASIPRAEWAAPTDPETVARRAAGRKGYNSLRQFRQTWRRRKLVALMGKGNFVAHGWQAQAARTLGVHRSTVNRDLRALLAEGRVRRCPHCRKPVVWAALPGEWRDPDEVLAEAWAD